MESSVDTPIEIETPFERVKTSKEKLKERSVERRNARRAKMTAEDRAAYEEKKVNYRAAVVTRIGELSDFIQIINDRYLNSDGQPYWSVFFPSTLNFEYEFRRFSPYPIQRLIEMTRSLINNVGDENNNLAKLRTINEGLRSIHQAVKDVTNIKQWRDQFHEGKIFVMQGDNLVPAFTENAEEHEAWVQEQERKKQEQEALRQRTAAYLESSKVKTGVSWKSLF